MPSPAGVLAPGEIRDFSFAVPEASRLSVLARADAEVELSFSAPDGAVLGVRDLGRVRGFRHERAEGIERFELDDPRPGTWRLRVDGSRTTTPRELVFSLTVETPFTVKVEPDGGGSVPMGDTVPVRAWIERDGAIVGGTSFTCDLVRYKERVGAVNLADDGAHGDGPAGDGLFGAAIVTAGEPGWHELRVAATLPDTLYGATLYAVGAYRLYLVEDLLVVPGSLTLSKQSVQAGDEVRILATVGNRGTSRVPNLEVEFLDGQRELGSLFVDLAPGETCDVELPWTVESRESWDLAVGVDPTTIEEVDYDNNMERTTVIAGQPVPRAASKAGRPCSMPERKPSR